MIFNAYIIVCSYSHTISMVYEITHTWDCGAEENIVTLHSEITDVRQSMIDTHYFLHTRKHSEIRDVRQYLG